MWHCSFTYRRSKPSLLLYAQYPYSHCIQSALYAATPRTLFVYAVNNSHQPAFRLGLCVLVLRHGFNKTCILWQSSKTGWWCRRLPNTSRPGRSSSSACASGIWGRALKQVHCRQCRCMDVNAGMLQLMRVVKPHGNSEVRRRMVQHRVRPCRISPPHPLPTSPASSSAAAAA